MHSRSGSTMDGPNGSEMGTALKNTCGLRSVSNSFNVAILSDTGAINSAKVFSEK